MDKKQIDARGLSCPQPVIEVMKALKTPAAGYEVLVDNNTAVENISRFLKNSGRAFTVRADGRDFIIEVEG